MSTATTTVSYTDIIVSLSTESSTVEQTVTVSTDVQEAATAYSTTVVETVTTVVMAQSTSQAPVKKRRGACGHGSSTTASTTSPEPSLSSSTVSESSSTPDSATSTTLSTSALVPVASNCPSLADYSSACSCISAIDTTQTVTAPASTSTSVVYATVSTTIPSVSGSTTTALETNLVTVSVTATITSTLTTATTSTTTLTKIIAPTQTGYLLIANGAREGKPLNVVSSYVQWANTGTGTAISFATAGGQQPWLPGQPNVKLFVHSANAQVGVLYFETDAQALTYGDSPVVCGMDVAGTVTCQIPAKGFSTMLQCGAYVYLSAPSFTQASCTLITLDMASPPAYLN